jgi:hypothetical protein
LFSFGVRSLGVRSLLVVAVVAFAIAGCGGSNAPVAPTQGPPAAGDGLTSAVHTVPAALSATKTAYAIPMSGGYTASLSLHSAGATPGTKILLGVQQPQTSIVSRMHGFSRTHNCPTTVTIPLINPFRFAITLNVDGFSLTLPCSVNGTLFGVSFYQLQPMPPITSSLKVGDITAVGNSISFSSDVATITLPPRTETALTIAPEGSTSEVALPLANSGTALLTSNAQTTPGPSTLALTYGSVGGGGSLFSSGCAPAFPDPSHPNVIASPLAGVPILGIPQYFCTLGTVNSDTVAFGPSNVTFTIASPLPDLSFIGYDGPTSQFPCNQPSGSTTTCITPTFTVPTVQNIIVGNALDLQICLPIVAETNCNSNADVFATPGPSLTTATAGTELDVLVADDPSYKPPSPAGPPAFLSSCVPAPPAICGSFKITTSGTADPSAPTGLVCAVDNGSDENGDSPNNYTDPGGPQELPAVSGGNSNSAIFPGVGPFSEIDIDTFGPGTCTVTVTEVDGPAQPFRSASLSVTLTGSSPSSRRFHMNAAQVR